MAWLRIIVAGVLLMAVAPLLAQDGRLRVLVEDMSGAPVARADVRVGGFTAKTGNDGFAVFGPLPSGRHTVTVSAPGFETWKADQNLGVGGEKRVEVQLRVGSLGGIQVMPVEPMKLEKTGRVRILVLNPLSQPVAGARVELSVANGDKREAMTDSKGTALLEKVQAGECNISVTQKNFQPWRKLRTVSFPGEPTIDVRLALSTHEETIDVKESAGRRFLNWLTSCTRKKG